MIDIFAVALEGRVNLLFTKVKGISPVYVPILHQSNFGITAAIFSLEETVV